MWEDAGWLKRDKGVPLEADLLQKVNGNGIPIPIFPTSETSHPSGKKGDHQVFVCGKLVEGAGIIPVICFP